MKIFAKSFEERFLFEKRQHPKTFIISGYYQVDFSRRIRRERSFAGPGGDGFIVGMSASCPICRGMRLAGRMASPVERVGRTPGIEPTMFGRLPLSGLMGLSSA
ncbi:hypothetical protein [Novacetimonas pomaceti]|uniref:hypothetical protein n=1 Tax=Novacetimonas pomaceti TaxID=2021998 RepID=UPI001057DA42|nr:hypothetical protein [Novacetimonas pomaceti]